MLCTVPECSREASATKELCRTHYMRLYRHDTLEILPRKSRRAPVKQCDALGCDEMARWKGYCTRHYARIHRNGTLELKGRFRVPNPGDPCGWCGEPIPPTKTRRAVFCSKKCNNNYQNRVLSGVTKAQYEAILEAQGGCCAICGTTNPGDRIKAFHMDHDHSCCPGGRGTCGKCFRGLLCWSCNIGMGGLKDDPELLEAAARYLRERRLNQ